MERAGGRLIADALVAQGVDRVFVVPGESFVDTLDGLYEVRDRVRVITCRFEGGAVYMAEAYAKLTGRCGVAMVTRGPGACQGAIGVHTAMQDGTPLIMFVGQIPTGHTDRDAFQEVDYRRMFGGMAKWVTQIDEAARIPEIVAHAVDVAASGRPGPVVIAIPENMQKQLADVPDIGRAVIAPVPPAPEALQRLGELLGAARRPLAILGGFGWSETGRRAIHAFAAAFDLPVTVSFRRQSLYDGTLPTYAGDLGVGSDPELLAKVKQADLIIAVGTRLGAAGRPRSSIHAPRRRSSTCIRKSRRSGACSGRCSASRAIRIRSPCTPRVCIPARCRGTTGRASCGACARRAARCRNTPAT